MSTMTPGQIVDVLARNESARLVGIEETEQVDFKLAPYRLAENHQKWEVAKDVAAFANKRGGIIVVGVECDSPVNAIVETAISIRPVRKTIVDLPQHRSVIDSWIYPRPEGIDLRWYPPETNQDLGLLLIEVPPQREALMPFILRDMRDPGGEFKGAVGIPRRDGERIVWDTSADIHRNLSGLPSVSGAVANRTNMLDRASARVSELETLQGWQESPVYFIQALPPQTEELVGFYDEIRRRLVSHQVLRLEGFAPWRNAEIESFGGGWLARRTDIVTLIEPDGLVTHGLLVSENTYLGWYFNQNRTEGSPLILHPIAVIETTLEFFRFLYSQIKPHAGRGAWQYRICCRRFQSNALTLPAGHPTQASLHVPPPNASSDELERVFNEAGTPTRDAFEALQRFYFFFGHPSTAIPLVENNAVSEEALVRLA